MNIQKTKIILAGLASAFLLTSCVNDLMNTGGEQEGTVTAWGEILRHEGKENFDIVLDNLDTVRTNNTSHINKEDTKTGTRIVFSATLHDKSSADPHVLYSGSLTDIMTVAIEKPILLSWVNEEQDRVDSVGNDPIEVLTMSVSGKYMNVDFRVRQNDGSIKHTIAFVVDDVNEVKDDVLNIYMKHNENGDVPAAPTRYLRSCDIKEYMDAVKGQYLTVNLFYYNGGSADLKKTFTWQK